MSLLCFSVSPRCDEMTRREEVWSEGRTEVAPLIMARRSSMSFMLARLVPSSYSRILARPDSDISACEEATVDAAP